MARKPHPTAPTQAEPARYSFVGPSRHARGKRRRRRFLAFFLLLLVGLLAAAPTIVSRTPLRDSVFRLLVPPEAGRLTCQTASFSWWGEQTLSGVSWRDATGEPLLEIQRATIEQSLASILLNWHELGKIDVLQPTAYVVVDAEQTNWQKTLAKLGAEESAAADDGAPLHAEVEIAEGVVVGSAADAGSAWRVDQLNLVASSSDEIGGWRIKGLGQAVEEGRQPGAIRFRIEPTGEQGHLVEIFADATPLAPLTPWLVRWLPGAQVTGVATADMRISWTSADAGPARFSADGTLELAHVALTADALAGDVLHVDAAEVQTQLVVENQTLTIDRLIANGDWFSASAQGMVQLDRLSAGGVEALPDSDASVSARVDLVQLARQLPRTLHLREGLRVDRGVAEVTASSVRVDDERQWTVIGLIENLHGQDGTREVAWSKPVRFETRFQAVGERPQFAMVRLEAPSATAKLSAVDGGFDGHYRFDLAELSSELAQFVDLNSWQLKGAGSGVCSLRPTSETGLLITAQSELHDIDVRHRGHPLWVDPQLFIDLQAAAQRDDQWSLRELVSATVKLNGVDDRLEAELLEGVDFTAEKTTYAVHLNGDGPLDSWLGRLRPWVDGLPQQQVAGHASVDLKLAIGSGQFAMTETEIDIEGLRMLLGETVVDEPRARLAGDCQWRSAGSVWTSDQLELTTSTIALRSRDLVWAWPEADGPIADGELAYRVDLERLSRWLSWTTGPEAAWPRGQAMGEIKLAGSGPTTTALVSLKGDNLAWMTLDPQQPAQPVAAWTEPHVDAEAELAYHRGEDRLDVSRLTAKGSTIELAGDASIERVQTAPAIRGEVRVAYAAAELSRLLASYFGPGLQLQGANEARVRFAGRLDDASESALASTASSPPHWSRRWNIISQAGWSTGTLYGLPLGQAKLQVNFDGGKVAIEPFAIPIGRGELTASGRMVLDPPPRTLELPPGRLLRNIAVSPEVSESFLKYAAPILAGATRIEGEFTADLDGARIPLEQPERTDAGGRLLIHELRILPGPTTEPLVAVVRQLSALARGKNLLTAGPAPPGSGIVVRQQQIDVRMLEGRVHHRNFEFMIDDVPVRSTGSVGLDESISLVVEVPVQEKWVRGSSAFRPLAGEVLKIPVEGTLTRWRVDDAFLADLVQQGAQQVIGNELNRALDRLFRSK